MRGYNVTDIACKKLPKVILAVTQAFNRFISKFYMQQAKLQISKHYRYAFIACLILFTSTVFSTNLNTNRNLVAHENPIERLYNQNKAQHLAQLVQLTQVSLVKQQANFAFSVSESFVSTATVQEKDLNLLKYTLVRAAP